jgi:uncharacterized protein YndB with AHSA1/START domain
MTVTPADPHALSRSIHIDAPPAKVWELITTVARVIEWYDAWDAVEHAANEERLRVGTSFRLIRHRIGRDATALCCVTSLEPLRRLCWLQCASRLPLMSVEFQLLPDTDGRTGTWMNHTRTSIEPAIRSAPRLTTTLEAR